MHVLRTNFHSNPNLGLFGFTTDSYCLLPKSVKASILKDIKEVLEVPIYQLHIFNTNLLGIFCVGNEKTLFVPEIIHKYELKEFKKIKNLKIIVLPTKFTALGNNILINKNNCLINPDLEPEAINMIKEAGFKVRKLEIAGLKTIGSCAIITNKGCLLHRDATNVKEISSFFNLPTDIGTVNLGNPYVKSGLIANSKGYIMGKATTGPEIQRIDETLKFL